MDEEFSILIEEYNGVYEYILTTGKNDNDPTIVCVCGINVHTRQEVPPITPERLGRALEYLANVN